jgi:hypothetical protein
MADVFIAYSRPDQETARRISVFLDSIGLSTWWDASLLPGESFVEVIDKELSASKIVLVLWSKSSIHSKWVNAEAMAAYRSNKLLPIIVDEISAGEIPIQFIGVQSLKFTKEIDFQLLEKAIGNLSAQSRPKPKPKIADVPVKKAFISYPSEIEDVAVSCVKFLEANGCTCWISFRDVDPGEDHREQIVAAIEKSNFLVCLYSNEANDSYDVATELLIARQENKKRLVLNVDHSKPNGRLRYELASVQWIEFNATHPESSFGKIALRAQVL